MSAERHTMSAAEHPDIILARLGSIVDSSDDAIISKTLDGIITSWNPAATRMFGYSASEAIGRHITLIIPADRHGEETEVLARLRRGERIDHFETLRQTKDGRLINISLTVSPLRGPTGAIIGASKIARDVTDRRRADEERAALLRQAQAANRAKDDFLAMFGHELRNPLAAVASAAYVIATARTLDEVSRPLAVITRQVGHVRRLIEDLLDAARVQTGKIALDRQPVNLREAAEHAVTVVRAGPVPIRHVIEVDADDVGALADPTRLEQIILNLLTNAVKYTPAGRRIRLTARAEDGQAVLRVVDEGVGLTAEAIGTIFDLFVQGDQAVDRAQGGLGIGLTLVRTLVELHGGTVEAASAGLGRGSTFTVRLPGTPLPSAGSSPASTLPMLRRRVLIVEDNEDNSEMLRVYLERLGHEVFVANDGAEGVQMASRVQPEVALVDLGLPSLDGLEVARHIRRQPHQPRHLVALTGYGQPEDRQRCLAAGFDSHLVKPIDPKRLHDLLEH
jgi:two-component system CheB/CheR fusion protein